MQNDSAANLQNNLAVSLKVQDKLTISSSNSPYNIYPREEELTSTQRLTHW